MIQLQVEAKSGLHAGAVWYMSRSRIMLGASSGADIFLCDPEVPNSLVTLVKRGRRYIIEGLDPTARITSADDKPFNNTLFPDQTLTLEVRNVQLELSTVSIAYGLASRFGESTTRFFYGVLQFLQGLGAKAIVALLFLVGLMLSTMVLFFGTAGVAKTHASVLDDYKKAAIAKPPLPQPDIGTMMAANVVQDFEKLGKKLGDGTIEAKHDKNAVTISARLSKLQMIEFEKELRRVGRDYGELVKIDAAVEITPEQQKVDQIRVSQVIMGKTPAVIVDEGTMLYVGAVYKGVTLSSVNTSKIVFKGQATYEVNL